MLIARKWSTFLCKNVNAVLVSFVALLNIFTSSESDDFVLQGPQKEEKPVVVPGRRKEHKVGKIHFVEHRTAFHLYHSFHRLWIFFLCMLQGLTIWAFCSKNKTLNLHVRTIKKIMSVVPTFVVMKLFKGDHQLLCLNFPLLCFFTRG
jgi:hypothetical protein